MKPELTQSEQFTYKAFRVKRHRLSVTQHEISIINTEGMEIFGGRIAGDYNTISRYKSLTAEDGRLNRWEATDAEIKAIIDDFIQRANNTVAIAGNKVIAATSQNEPRETAKSVLSAFGPNMLISGALIWRQGRVKGVILKDGRLMYYGDYHREFFTETQLKELAALPDTEFITHKTTTQCND
jgi:hypothetical protein